MKPIDLFLSRIKKVPPSRNGKYMVCCPNHDDRSPSLAVSEGDEGQLLLHCFAGCEVYDIVESVGLTLSDLFPDDTRQKPIPQKQDFESEKYYLTLAKNIKEQGLKMDALTMNRVELAIHRIKTGQKLGVI